MTDINKVFLVGRAVRDVEENDLTYTAGGTAMLRFSIASNRGKKVGNAWEEYASFFDITMWGDIAVGIANHIKKGKQLCVVGRLQQDRWQKDGKNFSKIVVIADYVQVFSSKSESVSKDFQEVTPF